MENFKISKMKTPLQRFHVVASKRSQPVISEYKRNYPFKSNYLRLTTLNL
jgi:hypothetical protein